MKVLAEFSNRNGYLRLLEYSYVAQRVIRKFNKMVKALATGVKITA